MCLNCYYLSWDQLVVFGLNKQITYFSDFFPNFSHFNCFYYKIIVKIYHISTKPGKKARLAKAGPKAEYFLFPFLIIIIVKIITNNLIDFIMVIIVNIIIVAIKVIFIMNFSLAVYWIQFFHDFLPFIINQIFTYVNITTISVIIIVVVIFTSSIKCIIIVVKKFGFNIVTNVIFDINFNFLIIKIILLINANAIFIVIGAIIIKVVIIVS